LICSILLLEEANIAAFLTLQFLRKHLSTRVSFILILFRHNVKDVRENVTHALDIPGGAIYRCLENLTKRNEFAYSMMTLTVGMFYKCQFLRVKSFIEVVKY